MLTRVTWYPLLPADETFLDTAPIVHHFPIRLDVPPERVWESLASDRSLADWSPAVRRLTWLTPRPFGVGTIREVALPLVTVREEYTRWDEGKGYSFFVREANRPLLTQFAENYDLEADGSGSLLNWTIAIRPKPALTPVLRALSPVNKLLFGQLARGAKRYFARHP